jgi:methyl-accepting chemotaxis protein
VRLMSLFNMFSIKARLLFSVAFMILVIIIIGGIGVNGLSRSEAAIESLYRNGMGHTTRMGEIIEHMQDSRSQLLLSFQHDPTSPFSKMHDHGIQSHLNIITADIAKVKKEIQVLLDSELEPEELATARKLKEHFNTVTVLGFTPVIEALKGNDYNRANEILLKVINPAFNNAKEEALRLVQMQETEAATMFSEAQERSTSSLFWTVALLVTGGIVGLMISGATIVSIKRAVQSLDQAATDLASGDLTARADPRGKDELSHIAVAFNSVGDKFQATVQEVISAVTQVASAAEETSVVTAQTTQSINQQRQETEMVATAMNQMNATVHDVAKNASFASEAAKEADKSSDEGQAVVQQTILAIDRLAEEVEKASQVIHGVEVESENIGAVLGVIRSIAEQTNLLALNAAIEAARAGDQGRGFAVVADEVRTLASRTQNSTAEIQEMITRLQSGAHSAVSAMEAGREKAQDGVAQANKAGKALERITSSVDQINNMNAQIATAAEEQTSVAEEINRNISNINQVAEHTAVGAEQTLAASNDLARLAEYLQETVSKFKVN